MLRILDSVSVPPGGWRYYVKETSTWITGITLRDLEHQTRLHYDANLIPIKEPLIYHIENTLCLTLPPDHCKDDMGSGPRFDLRISLSQALSGTLIMSTWFAKGSKYVDQEEADRRSDVCARCAYNVTPESGCSGCISQKMREAVEKVIGSRHAKYSEQLGACVGCGCALKASIWLPLDIQQKYTPKSINEKLPQHCWKKKHEEDISPRAEKA